jgi:hypothetical protein
METVSLSALPARNIGQEWRQTLRVLHGRIALAHAARRLHPARTASRCRVVDTTQMHLNDQFGDDMSENHAALGLGVGAIDLLEPAKDVRVVVLWDTGPTSLALALRWRDGAHALAVTRAAPGSVNLMEPPSRLRRTWVGLLTAKPDG